jgi:hypothetical protein
VVFDVLEKLKAQDLIDLGTVRQIVGSPGSHSHSSQQSSSWLAVSDNPRLESALRNVTQVAPPHGSPGQPFLDPSSLEALTQQRADLSDLRGSQARQWTNLGSLYWEQRDGTPRPL